MLRFGGLQSLLEFACEQSCLGLGRAKGFGSVQSLFGFELRKCKGVWGFTVAKS